MCKKFCIYCFSGLMKGPNYGGQIKFDGFESALFIDDLMIKMKFYGTKIIDKKC